MHFISEIKRLNLFYLMLFFLLIIPRAGQAAPYFTDNMEGASKWTEETPWATTTAAGSFHGGAKAWTDSPAGYYANNADNSLTLTTAIDLSPTTVTAPQLVFWHKYQLETDFDFGYVEISTDGGTNWQTAKLATYTGVSGWKREQIDLTAFKANVKIRFRIVTDKTVAWDGWYIDDVSIAEPPSAVATVSVVNPKATSLDITWDASLDPDFASYKIYRSTSAGVSTSSTLVTTITVKGTGTQTYTDQNLTPNTTYYYKVYVFNANDLAAGTHEASGKTAIAQFAYPFLDGMEGSVDGWLANAPWGRTTADKHAGTYAWTDSPDSSYAASADASLQMSIDLGTAIMPVLSFWQRYTFEPDADFGFVEVKEAGTTAWGRIYAATGTLAAWTEQKIDLSNYAGKKLDIRFRVTANASIQSDGWYIDDIRIGETQGAVIIYPFIDPMETGTNWISSSWALAANPHAGTYAFTDSPAGNYGPETYSELIMANTIDLKDAKHPQLSFWHKYDTINKPNYGGGGSYYTSEYDYARVLLSTKKGQPGTWTELRSYRGSQAAWTKVQIDLSAWAGLPDVRIKFVMDDNLASDNANQRAAGWTIDDVVIEDVPVDVTLSLTSSTMNAVVLNWTQNSDTDFAQYEIYRADAPGVTRSHTLISTITARTTTTYPDTVALVQPGAYYYRIWVVDGDGNTSLGSNEVQATYTVPLNIYPFTENGESGTAQWSWGAPWGLTTTDKYEGTSAWTDSPGANYQANANTSLSTFLNLTGSTTPVLTFWHKYSLSSLSDSKDFVRLEVSTDNGQTWTALRTFTGTETAWNQERVNLTPYAGNAKLGLRFRLTSDAASQQDGWYMDNLQVKEESISATYPFTDDIEQGASPWFYDSPWGIVQLTAAESHTGTTASKVWTDSPGSSYASGADSSLQLSIDLGAASMPVLSFWHRFAFDANSDYGYVEIREGGTTAWNRLYFVTGTAPWTEAKVDLANYAGKQVDIRFRIVADTNNTESDGWYIDDIRIGETQGTALIYPLIDHMETATNWISSSWALAADPHAGSYAFTDSAAGNYGPNTYSELIVANTIDLKDAKHPQLSFWHKYDTINKPNYGGGGSYYTNEYDYARVLLSTKKGQPGTWTELRSYRGSQADWKKEQIDLSAWAGLPDVRIKFVMDDNLASDNANQRAAGWTIDDVAMEDAPVDVNLSLTSSTMSTVDISWTANTDADFDRYEIYRSDAPGVTRSSTLISTITAKATTTYPDTVAMVQPGAYYYRVWVVDSDGNISMGSNEVQATYTVPLNTYPFTENGESGNVKWSWGAPWGLTTTDKYEGTSAWTDSPGANYQANANTSLTTFLNLTGSTTPVLTFWHKYSLEEGKDFVLLEVSTNNGQAWTTVKSYSGTETAWNQERVNLTSYAGNAKLGLRFRLTSDAASQQDGWYMDNLQIKEESIRAAYPFSDDMEQGITPWFYDSPWGRTSADKHSGSFAWTDSPDSSYAPGADTSLYLTIDLGAASMPVLSFWHRYSFDANSDYGYIEVKEGGTTTWNRLYFITGTSPWTEAKVDLANYAGKQVDIRFRVFADANGVQSDGWYIDDIRIGETQHLPFAYPFVDDMETLDNWHGSSWALVSDKYTGTYAATDSALGNYGPEVYSELIMANIIDLRSSVHPQLTFWHKYDTINKANYGGGGSYYTNEYDYVRVLISTNKGQPGTWKELASYKGSQTASWTEGKIDLSNWAGLPDVRIKFVMDDNLASDNANQRAGGWTVDKIRIGEDETIPSTIAKFSGDGQVGETAKALSNALVARVIDSDSKPRVGIKVNFAVATGAGSLSTLSGTTDAGGLVSSTLTLDTVSGANTVTATIDGTTQLVTFTATGFAAGQAMRIRKISGDNQVNAVNLALPNPLMVKVTDVLGDPVPGASVTFSKLSGGGAISPATPDTVTTDDSGLASKNFTLGATTGVSTITATSTGLIGSPLTFTANAVLTGGSLGDTDGDGMPDAWETAYSLDPLSSADAASDADGDNLTNLEEYTRGTDPKKTDTDNDGMPDNWEVQYGLNPLDPSDAVKDYNNNGKSNLQDYLDGNAPVSQRHFNVARVTSESVAVYGLVTIDGVAAEPGDEVAAICPGNVVCGQFTVETGKPGQYGFMHVYKDDPATEAKDGASPGDSLTFRVWDASAGVELDVTTQVLTGANPATWGADGDIYHINLNAAGKQIIPLRAGWNLISFAVKNCYYVGDAVPSAPMLTGINYIKVTSIDAALSSISGLYDVVRSFDDQGAHTFDPALPAFSDLKYLAAGYGYWIKMKSAADLELKGLKVQPTESLYLKSGWNLVGYWGSDIRYIDTQPTVSFPPDATTFTPLTSLNAAFTAISGNYSVVRAFDAGGSHTFDPALPSYLNSMKYLGPGYGMWIKMKTPDDLSY